MTDNAEETTDPDTPTSHHPMTETARRKDSHASARRRVIAIGLSVAAIIGVAALVLDTLPSVSNGANARQTTARAASTLPPLEIGLPTATPSALPPSAPVSPLLATIPRTASAQRSTVAGYPPVLRSLLAGATVTATSVASAGTIVQADMTGTAPVSAGTAVKSVTAALSKLRFSSTLMQSAATTTTLVFRTKGQDTVTVAITPTGTSTISFSVHAVLRTAKK